MKKNLKDKYGNIIQQNVEEKKPEKFFAKAIELYFSFHKHNYKDEDGFALAPSWNGAKRGMEMRSLKLILETLRQIAEGKNAEWTEERMINDFNLFLEKSYNHSLVRKNFLCAIMNRFKFDILSSNYNPQLAKKVREWWYFENKEYTVDVDKDREASEIIVVFLKKQFVVNSIQFTEDALIQSWRTIIKHIKSDSFWSIKSLKSIANHMQEFVNKIKANQNGRNNNLDRTSKAPVVTNNTPGDFGDL